MTANGAGGASTLLWLHSNHLGTPVRASTATGAATPLTGFTLPGFPGQLQTLPDLYYNQHRDYDPTTGRYIQADPIGLVGDPNPYLYAGASPMRMVDPEGLEIRNVLPFNERGMRAAVERHYNSMPADMRNGFVHIFGHGNPNVICLYTSSGPTCLNPQQFRNWLIDNHVNRNLPIMLWACSTGQEEGGRASFARQLSGLMPDRLVVAPTQNTSWWSRSSIGRGYAGMRNDGNWAGFRNGQRIYRGGISQ